MAAAVRARAGHARAGGDVADVRAAAALLYALSRWRAPPCGALRSAIFEVIAPPESLERASAPQLAELLQSLTVLRVALPDAWVQAAVQRGALLLSVSETEGPAGRAEARTVDLLRATGAQARGESCEDGVVDMASATATPQCLHHRSHTRTTASSSSSRGGVISFGRGGATARGAMSALAASPEVRSPCSGAAAYESSGSQRRDRGGGPSQTLGESAPVCAEAAAAASAPTATLISNDAAASAAANAAPASAAADLERTRLARLAASLRSAARRGLR
uniref:Uncharacterized protein n=1 Tax=Chlamydomonas euryale TaxID=1486919 RepID=A0A7R9YZX5_9CHLO